MAMKVMAQYIVADPAVCHGKLTFRGTRIMVHQVLDQVARDMSWDDIVSEWRGAVSKDAIEEAIRLAQDALDAQSANPVLESASG